MRRRRRAIVPMPLSPEPERVVTDHAVVRWVERVLGLDLRGKVEADMLADGRRDLIRRIKTGRLHMKNPPATLQICNGRVVTVTPRGGKKP